MDSGRLSSDKARAWATTAFRLYSCPIFLWLLCSEIKPLKHLCLVGSDSELRSAVHECVHVPAQTPMRETTGTGVGVSGDRKRRRKVI